MQFIDEPYNEVVEKFRVQMLANSSQSNFQEWESTTFINTNYGTLIKGGLKTFGCNYSIQIKLDAIKYEVVVDEFTGDSTQKRAKLFENLLHKPLTETDIKKIVKKFSYLQFLVYIRKASMSFRKIIKIN